MGQERVETTQVQQATPTAEERALNQLELERAQAAQPGMINLQGLGMEAVSRLLAGETLPGNLAKLSGGIGEELAREMAQNAVEDIRPYFQKSGILDSGTAASVMARTAGDIRRSVGEFNIGTLLNLLNLGVGGQAQVQQPITSSAIALGQRLAGLRTTTGTGTQTTGTNFFASPFGAGIGQGLGQGVGTTFGTMLFGG